MDIAECYRVLELTSLASAKDLKSSYRRLARQWHPDVNPNDHQAHEMFIRLNEAYEVLQTIVPAQPAPSPSVVNPSTGKSSTSKSSTSKSSTSKSSMSNSGIGSPNPTAQATPATRSAKPASSPSSTQSATTAANRQTNPHQSASQPGGGQKNANASKAVNARAAKAEQVKAETKTVNTGASKKTEEHTLKIQAYEQLQTLIKGHRYPRAVTLIEALGQRLPNDVEVRQWQAIIYQRRGRQLINERKFNQARAYLKKAMMTDPSNKSLISDVERDLQNLRATV